MRQGKTVSRNRELYLSCEVIRLLIVCGIPLFVLKRRLAGVPYVRRSGVYRWEYPSMTPALIVEPPVV